MTLPEKATTLPDTSVRIMVRVMEAEGLDTQAALEAAGLAGLPDVPGLVTATQEFQFQRAFVAATGYRPDLWVRTGSAYHLPSFGELGLALITSSSLDDYLNLNLDTRELDYSLADTRPIEHDRKSTGFSIDVAQVPEELRDFTLYRDLGAIVTTLRDLWGDRFPLQPVEVAMPRPSNREFTVLGENVNFNAERNAVTWDRQLNGRPLRFGDSMLHSAYLESCKRRSRVRGSKSDFVEILAGFIRDGRAEHLSLAALAAEVGASERTLQRRLMARDVRFRDLVNEARRRSAMDMLTRGDKTMSEVAYQLGYSDTISFSHAFRRWTGVSPGTLRQQRRG